MSREERTLIELNVTEEERIAINEALENVANKNELAEFRKEYIPVKVEHLYLVNNRKKLFAGNCPICKSWVSEEFADMGDKEMRYCYRCGNELNFKGAE